MQRFKAGYRKLETFLRQLSTLRFYHNKDSCIVSLPVYALEGLHHAQSLEQEVRVLLLHPPCYAVVSRYLQEAKI